MNRPTWWRSEYENSALLYSAASYGVSCEQALSLAAARIDELEKRLQRVLELQHRPIIIAKDAFYVDGETP